MGRINYTLQFRPISELISEVQLYLTKYNSTSVIQPHDIITTALTCTYDLGLRIFNNFENVLEIYHYNAKLPDNFYALNFALLCSIKDSYTIIPQGTHLEDVILEDNNIINPCEHVSPCGDNNSCSCNQTQPRKICTTCNGKDYEIVQHIGIQKITYNNFVPIRLKYKSGIMKTCNGCPNINANSPYEMDIRYGYIYTNLEGGNIYINYLGYPQDEDGNMLIPDNPILNEYYLYATIRKILEKLLINSVINPNIISYIEERYRRARNNAVSLVNTPNFSELRNMWEVNRAAQYAKYYSFFTRH